MRFSVNFDRKASIAAEEIEHVRPRGMLPAEFETAEPLPKPVPEDHFGQRHLSAQLASVPRRSRPRLWCNVSEHPLHRASHGPPPRDKLGEDLRREREQLPRLRFVLA